MQDLCIFVLTGVLLGSLTEGVGVVTDSSSSSLWGPFPPTLPHSLDVMICNWFYYSVLFCVFLGGLLFSEGRQRGCGSGERGEMGDKDSGEEREGKPQLGCNI